MALLVVAIGIAFVDWFAVRRDLPALENIAKPLVMAILLLAVVSSGVSTTSGLVAVGLACSLVGDVLLLARVDRFLAGLAAFFVGHLFFIAAFVTTTSEGNVLWFAAATAIAALLAVVVGRPIVVGASKDPKLRAPVGAYIAVLSAMLIAGGSTGSAVAALGAFLFASSDAVLGWNRFVTPLSHGRFWTHVPYHSGQALIAAWAISATSL